MSIGRTTSYPLRRVIASKVEFDLLEGEPVPAWETTPQKRTDELECGHTVGPQIMPPAARRRCTRCPSNDRRGPVPRPEPR